MKLASFVGCAMGFGIIAIANTFTPVYFGSRYAEASTLMAALSVSVFAVSWANVIRTQYLLPNKFDKFYTASVVSGCVINVIGNYFLIAKFQALGAVIATIFTEYVVFFVQAFFSRKELEFKEYFLDNIHFILNGCVMVLIGRFLGNVVGATISGVIIQVLVCGGYYVIVSIIILCYVKKDMDFVRSFGKLKCLFRRR